MFLLTTLRQMKNGELICGNSRRLCPVRKRRRTFLWKTHKEDIWFCKIACAERLAELEGMIVTSDSFTTETGVHILTFQPSISRMHLRPSLT